MAVIAVCCKTNSANTGRRMHQQNYIHRQPRNADLCIIFNVRLCSMLFLYFLNNELDLHHSFTSWGMDFSSIDTIPNDSFNFPRNQQANKLTTSKKNTPMKFQTTHRGEYHLFTFYNSIDPTKAPHCLYFKLGRPTTSLVLFIVKYPLSSICFRTASQLVG